MLRSAPASSSSKGRHHVFECDDSSVSVTSNDSFSSSPTVVPAPSSSSGWSLLKRRTKSPGADKGKGGSSTKSNPSPNNGKPPGGKTLLTTPQTLRNILSKKYYACTGSFHHYDQIVPGLYLGDMKAAKNIFCLEKLRITHILNSAYTASPFTDTDLSAGYYEGRNFPCHFFGIPALDFPSFKLGAYFEASNNFIDLAIKRGGRVFVHCHVGVSRSATLVIAYLMGRHKMTAVDAVRHVGEIRPIFPNEGFLKQICDYEFKLNSPKNKILRSLSSVSRKAIIKVFNKT